MTLDERWKKAVRHYQALFHLESWELYIRVETVGDKNAAMMIPAHSSHQAIVRMAPDALEATEPMARIADGEAQIIFPQNLDSLAAHEMLHLLMDSYDRFNSVLVATEGEVPTIKKAAYHERDTEFERLISWLAKIIAQLSPSGAEW